VEESVRRKVMTFRTTETEMKLARLRSDQLRICVSEYLRRLIRADAKANVLRGFEDPEL
jgi:hypothetical protein